MNADMLSKILPIDPTKRKWLSIILPVLLSAPLTLWGIYAIGEYGIALFFLTPFFMAFASTVLYGYNRKLKKRQAFKISLMALGIFTLGLIFFAVEGLICIAMAAPIAIIMTFIGTLFGLLFTGGEARNVVGIMLLLFFSIPLTSFLEKEVDLPQYSVSTTVIVNAPIEQVWKNVIEFPTMAEPSEFIFKAGVSYPIDANIEGIGKDAIRYCNFNTGSFVEPITLWAEPELLKFDVREQPVPMVEYSLWSIDAPHLHDYFVSTQGEFKLSQLENGTVLLQGTTWYHHRIKPGIYWKVWSDWIIHSIHERVLNHIKLNAENISKQTKQL